MKIENNPKINPSVTPQSNKINSSSPSKSFGQILKETTQTEPTKTAKMAGPSPLLPLVPLNQIVPDKGVDKQIVVAKLEKLLDVLDQYRSYLDDPQRSLRDMAPITQDLADNIEKLAPELEKLDSDDSLLPILNETLITASLEIKKFESGWYNP